MIARILQIILRHTWGNLKLLWVNLQIFIWGSDAFENSVFHAPAWFALKLLKHHGTVIGHGIDFHGRLKLHGTYDVNGKLVIGEWCHIGPYVTLDLSNHIYIEDHVTISLNTQIISHIDVGYSPLAQLYPSRSKPVTIRSGAYIGAGATILMGVTIGENSIVAASALVTKDVPANTIVAGIPAKPIKQIATNQNEMDIA
ncbi:MAG: acyltransferase [Phototrophicaceae bacterium]